MIEFRAGAARVVIVPDAGGRIGQIEVDGNALLRGPEDASAGWAGWGSYPLLPWSNRIPNGTFTFDGRQRHVPVNWDDGSALHGLTAWLPWTVANCRDDGVELAINVAEGCYDVAGRQTFQLTPTHLDQMLEVTNEGPDRVPVGLGIHPWFRAGPVRVPADRMWPGDGPLPTGPPVAVGPDDDLRTPRVPPPMDRCYTGLTATTADVPGLRLHWSGPVTQVVVYSGEPGWVCVEPVTMANDGFRLAHDDAPESGVLVLDPGAAVAVSYRFEWLDSST